MASELEDFDFEWLKDRLDELARIGYGMVYRNTYLDLLRSFCKNFDSVQVVHEVAKETGILPRLFIMNDKDMLNSHSSFHISITSFYDPETDQYEKENRETTNQDRAIAKLQKEYVDHLKSIYRVKRG